jgi:hypothetical protein
LPDPEPPPNTYEPADFIRDYDANEACLDGEHPVWGLWSWSTSTPSDSQIEFYVKAANTLAGLDSAQETTLKFKDVPSSLDGQPVIARTSPVNTIIGSAPVHDTLAGASLNTQARFVRVRSRLVPSADGLQAPSMSNWNLQLSCQPNQ